MINFSAISWPDNDNDGNYPVSKPRGGSRGGVCTQHVPPLKLEKIWFFGVKSWFFTRNTPTIFVPPSARRNFFKCAPPLPLTWNPGSAPEANQSLLLLLNTVCLAKKQQLFCCCTFWYIKWNKKKNVLQSLQK